MTSPGQPELDLTAVLTPKGFEEAVLCSGAEYVEVRTARDGAMQQRLLVVPDEEERRRRVAMTDTPEELRQLHLQKLAELQSARDTLLSDDRVRKFLPSQDVCFWPNVEALRDFVTTVSFLKERADTPPDRQGALAMMRAMRVLDSESTYPGVYTLREVQLEGSLEMYKVTETTELVPGASPLSRDKDASPAPSNRIPSKLERQAAQPTAPKPFLLDASATLSTMGALDAVEERVTPTTQRTLLGHVSGSSPDATIATTSPMETRKRWAELIQIHRQSILDNGAPLFVDVQEALRLLGLNEVNLASLMHTAASTGQGQVRLRVGANAAVVHFPSVTCVLLGKSPDEVTAEEAEGVRATTGECEVVHVLPCAPTDDVFSGNMARVRAIVKSNFTSPVLLRGATRSDGLRIDQVVTVSPLICVLRAHTESSTGINPFVVVYGSRIENGFHGDAETLAHVKRHRQKTLDELTEVTRLAAFRSEPVAANQRGKTGSGAATVAPAPLSSSTTDPSRDVRAQVHSCVVQVLSTSDRPLSKTEIGDQPSFAAVRQHPAFRRFLSDALEELAETVSRKFVLKQ